MDVSKIPAAVVSLIVAASLTGTCGAARAAADDIARQTAIRATALAPDARAACAAVTDTSRALLRHIEASGDGTTPATAWQPCLVGNEYAFVQQMLGAREVKQQSLIHEGGRHYDKLELRMADGSTREVFFDVTEVFERNSEALLMR